MTDEDRRARRRARNSHALAHCNGMGRTAGSVLWQPMRRVDGKYFMACGAELAEPPIEFRSEKFETILDEMDARDVDVPTPVMQPLAEWKAEVDAAMANRLGPPPDTAVYDKFVYNQPPTIIVTPGGVVSLSELEKAIVEPRAIRASGVGEPFGPIPADHPDLIHLDGSPANSKFKPYRRSQIAELRPYVDGELLEGVSMSVEDRKAGSPKPGDMIARNPKNHADQWLVAEQYFKDNFEVTEPKEPTVAIPTTTPEPVEPMLQFFTYAHLPAHLQDVSRIFGDLAETIIRDIPRNPERTVALRKLLEAKDCAVRAVLYK